MQLQESFWLFLNLLVLGGGRSVVLIGLAGRKAIAGGVCVGFSSDSCRVAWKT